jgi:hypothetical protein
LSFIKRSTANLAGTPSAACRLPALHYGNQVLGFKLTRQVQGNGSVDRYAEQAGYFVKREDGGTSELPPLGMALSLARAGLHALAISCRRNQCAPVTAQPRMAYAINHIHP